ncbi:MAG: 2-oxoglutarate dehydrogenase complex dihydrolipoyllysine-residue succinyltransferase [Bacteroidales bacterium]|jgi:2-oxoglutarate dehydrogenase E2 component (dihydrolipoamide succinyltransferase)|nr:2-oxoglutarate dehydrogenase complex dihydrolipoyllysine-residue succinyltransferase [Bacteroidales bacterium]
MAIEIKVPSPGESIIEVQLANWLVEDGSFVEKDQDIAEIDSDKATLSIAAEESGTIHFKASAGDTIDVGAVIATIDVDASAPQGEKESKSDSEKMAVKEEKTNKAVEETKKQPKTAEKIVDSEGKASQEQKLKLSPLARKLMEKENISEQELMDFFKHYRVDTKDISFFKENKDKHEVTPSTQFLVQNSWGGARDEERKKMSMLRKKLSQRLVSVKNETAMLTTFNEVNMTPIIEIRKKYKEVFKEQHGIGLGFMSFFTKAVTEALHLFPQVNAQIDGDEIVYYDYADISIAVSGPKGLVVPVVRNAETMSLAAIERKIKELAVKARDNKLSLDEMTGGTFTITNGGVFGSMLSTPIINPPQSAILGMHNIVERPIAVDGKVEIHPIMYVALSYDHRIIDGRESVSFLVKVKELLENPVKMMFGSKDPIEVLLEL